MFSLIPLLLVLLSLGVVLFIVAKKWPQLTLLDVGNLPKIKESKKKKEFLMRRAKEEMREKKASLTEKYLTRFTGVFDHSKDMFKGYVSQLSEKIKAQEAAQVERKKTNKSTTEQGAVRPIPELETETTATQVHRLLDEAKRAVELESLSVAESKYIAIIRLDEKNTEAYKGLAQVYDLQGQTQEAMETYLFVLKMDPSDDAVLMRLAELYEEKQDVDKAIEMYQQAVIVNPNLANRFAKLTDLFEKVGQEQAAMTAIQEALDLDEQNPKYLDKLIELAIIVRDKNTAEHGFQQLRMVNPEHPKLESFKDRIKNIV